ncbi:hypothetical protein [Calderihabitans maritimus]|uniref:Uncharacterized protein n=1 Tax=Calderihabitans maritimus TaxID=1246530 RepID=A0A1Z5HPA7_9FIRM|nr:hypothetical protein [Calderihabitans maritimus]GAW91217.1 hypothetical protein KKC1_03790 [Calderihabitans maritimus]
MTEFIDNAEDSFKCARCGNTFPIYGNSPARCPICGFQCTAETCSPVDASDEGY